MVGRGKNRQKFSAGAVLLALLAAASGAQAQAEACGTENLLAKKIAQTERVRRAPSLLTDGVIGAEGAYWDAALATILDAPSSSITFDLGAEHTLSGFYLQGDANDTYDVMGSRDGSSYQLLTRVPNVVTQGHGLRARSVKFDASPVRYVRVTNARGDDFFSVSEVAAFCSIPARFPPAFQVDASSYNRSQTDALAERTARIAGREHVWWLVALGFALVGASTWLLGRRRALADAPPQPKAATELFGVERRLILMFLASGCAALIYEVVWVHLLRLVIGASSLSVGIVLSSFMGGMFVGSLLFARWVPRQRDPLRVYVALEVGIAVCGLLMPIVLPFVRSVYAGAAGHGPLGIALRACIAAILILPPTALMGATLPAIARRYAHDAAESRSRLAGLYAANTLGAVLGCLLAGFYLLAVWDVWVATATAVALNLGIAALALYTAKSRPAATSGGALPIIALERPTPILELTPSVAPQPLPRPALVYVAIALSGLTALAAQALWTRLLTLLFGATVYAFSIILAVFLGGLGIGAVVAARLLASGVSPIRALAFTQLGLVPTLLWSSGLLAEVLPYSSPTTLTPVTTLHALHVLRAIEVMLPAAVLWGMSFPFALAAVRHDDPSRAAGQVYAANTVGSIFGALLVSFWAIPAHGTHWTAQALIMVASVSAALLVSKAVRMRSTAAQLGAALAALAIGATGAALTPAVSGVFLAHGRHIWSVDPRDQYPYISEGAASTVAVHVAPDGSQHFHVSGRVEASTNRADMRLQRLLGHLSALAHPKPKSVLVVGLGAGVTAGALVRHADIERVVICEIEPRVTGAARQFTKENYAVLDDPRVQVVFDDARHFLATTSERFDIITSDPIHPWVRGNSVLFSREYYDIVKSRLKPGGIATQWVPLYDTVETAIQIQMRTFFSAFPEASVWNSSALGRGYDVVLLGRAKPEPLDVAAIQRRFEGVPAIAESLGEVGVYNVVDLFATYGASAKDMSAWVSGVGENRDFSLKLEYISGLALNQQNADRIYANMVARRSVPADMFTGPEELLTKIRARILSGRPTGP